MKCNKEGWTIIIMDPLKCGILNKETTRCMMALTALKMEKKLLLVDFGFDVSVDSIKPFCSSILLIFFALKLTFLKLAAPNIFLYATQKV